jgi:hypothetical protein
LVASPPDLSTAMERTIERRSTGLAEDQGSQFSPSPSRSGRRLLGACWTGPAGRVPTHIGSCLTHIEARNRVTSPSS